MLNYVYFNTPQKMKNCFFKLKAAGVKNLYTIYHVIPNAAAGTKTKYFIYYEGGGK